MNKEDAVYVVCVCVCVCVCRDLGLIPGLGRSPGEGKGSPLQYSGLENSMECIVLWVTKSWTRLSDFHFHTLAAAWMTLEIIILSEVSHTKTNII